MGFILKVIISVPISIVGGMYFGTVFTAIPAIFGGLIVGLVFRVPEFGVIVSMSMVFAGIVITIPWMFYKFFTDEETWIGLGIN